MRLQMSTLRSAVRAWPSSSMARQIDRGAVLACERHHPVEARARLLAVFEVGRVEDRLAAGVLQARFEHGRLGGVEHERQRRLGGEAARRARACRRRRRGRRSRRRRRGRARLPSPARAPSARSVSQSASSIASRNFFDPFAFVRSPMTRNDESWWNGHGRVHRRAARLVVGRARRGRARRRCGRRPPRGARAWCRNSRRRCSCRTR